MLQVARAIIGVVSDVLRLGVSFLRSSSAIRADDLVLRKQLASYIERGIKPRRVDHATRVSLALFTRLFDWRDAVVSVRPSTIVRGHRLGWRIFWRWKCRAVRPPITAELRGLIRRMAAENPLWGEERIANELLVKLGIRVSPRTVGKYMPKRPPVKARGDQRWSTFLKNHCKGDPRVRLLRSGHCDIPNAVCICCHRARDTPIGACKRDRIPECRLDVAAVAGGRRRGRRASVSYQ